MTVRLIDTLSGPVRLGWPSGCRSTHASAASTAGVSATRVPAAVNRTVGVCGGDGALHGIALHRTRELHLHSTAVRRLPACRERDVVPVEGAADRQVRAAHGIADGSVHIIAALVQNQLERGSRV